MKAIYFETVIGNLVKVRVVFRIVSPISTNYHCQALETAHGYTKGDMITSHRITLVHKAKRSGCYNMVTTASIPEDIPTFETGF